MSTSDSELVIIRLTQPWAIQGGGAYNPGERVAFSRAIANDILEKNAGYEEPLPTKSPQQPDTNKMVEAPVTRKRQRPIIKEGGAHE